MLAKIQLPRAVYKAVESETFLGLVEAVSTAISQELLGMVMIIASLKMLSKQRVVSYMYLQEMHC